MKKDQKFLGEKFGKLTFVRKTNERNVRNRILYELICECGKTCFFSKRFSYRW